MERRAPEVEISSYVGRLLRDNFGKGPESVFVTIARPFIVIHMRNFISPMETALLNQENLNIVQNTREIVFTNLVPEIKAYIKGLAGLEIEEAFFDWNLQNKSGVFVGLTDLTEAGMEMSDKVPNKEALHHKINKISAEAQKVPDETSSYNINGRMLIFVRDGILVRIEKELIRQGYEKILKSTKRILEKKYLHNSDLDSLIQQDCSDIFVDWDFSRDRSVIVLILRPKG
ncbi:DUF2294 domain-containing protein [Peribacillus kribbensis]|uniref:DUF2294 domain-containing protein n=1 Tax=Peribacillus kribbensis TaxID=356658 RepID=UPI00047C08DA|nr:Na-translocating system protein MpsC family protein [Peribacillus kribbensis]